MSTTDFIKDWRDVQRIRLQQTGGATFRALVAAIAALDLPPYEAIASCALQAHTELGWRARDRALTDDELRAQAAARRLLDAIHKTDKEFR